MKTKKIWINFIAIFVVVLFVTVIFVVTSEPSESELRYERLKTVKTLTNELRGLSMRYVNFETYQVEKDRLVEELNKLNISELEIDEYGVRPYFTILNEYGGCK